MRKTYSGHSIILSDHDVSEMRILGGLNIRKTDGRKILEMGELGGF
jgi:hypothetical protein